MPRIGHSAVVAHVLAVAAVMSGCVSPPRAIVPTREVTLDPMPKSILGTHRYACVRWNPAKEFLAAAREFGMVDLWDPTQDAPVATLEDSDSEDVDVLEAPRVAEIAWSPDGSMLAAGLSSGIVVIWELASIEAAAKARELARFVVGQTEIKGLSWCRWTFKIAEI